MALDRPILITGTPRSGKSCVANMLKQAPEFCYLNEPLMLWDVPAGGRADDCRTAVDANDTLRARIVGACERAVAEAGKQRYLDNLSYHALRIGFVRQIMPEARIIHVIRNPRLAIPEMLFGWTNKDSVLKAVSRRRKAVQIRSLPRHLWRFGVNYVRSRLKGSRSTWGPRVPGLAEFAASHSTAEVAAYQWQRMTEIALADLAKLPDEQWLQVRHEQLINDPLNQGRRIAEFCQVSDPEATARYAMDFFDPNHQFEKRVEPTQEQWRKIEARIQPLAESLGYDGSLSGGQSGGPCGGSCSEETAKASHDS